MDAYLQCYLDKMDFEKSKLLMSRLGVRKCALWVADGIADTSSSCYQTLRANFISEFSRRECEGHDSDLYRSRCVAVTVCYCLLLW